MFIENSSFATFFFKILKNAYISNLVLFINICKIDNLYKKGSLEYFLPFANKIILPFIIENVEISKKIIELTKNLYINYYSYEPFSKRTIAQDEDGNDIHPTIEKECRDTITQGELNHQDFNSFLNILLNTYIEHHLFYNIQNDNIYVKYYDSEMKIIKTETIKLKKRRNKYYLYRNGKLKHIANKKIKHIGLKSILKIHENILNELQKPLEACTWCNPITSTKHKCINCKHLYDDYQKLRKEYKTLPKDINQIIKRTTKHADKLDISCKKEIHKKIKDLVKRHLCKEDVNFNRSGSVEAFFISLDNAFNI